jgi:hypothetical protein
MICPTCGKKTLLDFLQCPRCGVDPYPPPKTTSDLTASTLNSQDHQVPSSPTDCPIPIPNKYSFPEKNGLWPIIKTAEAAHWAARQGAWASFIIAAFTLVAIIAISILKTDLSIKLEVTYFTYFNVIAFIIIGLAIWRRYSRLAALSGLILYLVGKVTIWQIVTTSSLLLIVAFTLSFVHSVRGCYAWHRFKESNNIAPYQQEL